MEQNECRPITGGRGIQAEARKMGYFTVRVMEAECCSEPDLPITVTKKVPCTVLVLVYSVGPERSPGPAAARKALLPLV